MNEIHDSKIIKYEVDFQKSTLMMELTTYQVEELSKKLRQDNYHYFVINSSYGLNGYVIAKNLIKI